MVWSQPISSPGTALSIVWFQPISSCCWLSTVLNPDVKSANLKQIIEGWNFISIFHDLDINDNITFALNFLLYLISLSGVPDGLLPEVDLNTLGFNKKLWLKFDPNLTFSIFYSVVADSFSIKYIKKIIG